MIGLVVGSSVFREHNHREAFEPVSKLFHKSNKDYHSRLVRGEGNSCIQLLEIVLGIIDVEFSGV